MAVTPDATRIVLRGDFDIADDARIADVFSAVIGTERVVIDLTDVRYIDSTLLNSLIRLQRARISAGRKPVVLTGLSPHVERIVRIARLDRVLEIQRGKRRENLGSRTCDVVLVGGWA